MTNNVSTWNSCILLVNKLLKVEISVLNVAARRLKLFWFRSWDPECEKSVTTQMCIFHVPRQVCMCSMQLLLQHKAHPVTWNSIRMETRLAVPTQERICLLVKVPTCSCLNYKRRTLYSWRQQVIVPWMRQTLCPWELPMIVPWMEMTTTFPFQGLRLTKCKH